MCRKNEREKVIAVREKKMIINKCALWTSQTCGEKGNGKGEGDGEVRGGNRRVFWNQLPVGDPQSFHSEVLGEEQTHPSNPSGFSTSPA